MSRPSRARFDNSDTLRDTSALTGHTGSDDSKPVFLTRQQREVEALKRLDEKRRQREQQLKQIEAIANIITVAATSTTTTAIPANRPTNGSTRPNNATNNNNSNGSQSAKSASIVISDEMDDYRQKELALIKAQHLGHRLDHQHANGKLLQSQLQSSKTRFTFDWNASDDTAQDPHALYTARHETQLLFGRGFMGGVDRTEQRKRLTRDTLDNERKSATFNHITDNKKNNRESALLSMSCHWSDKSLADMIERDWRIFKEDFEITTRGSRIPRPLRSWRESSLPPAMLRAIKSSGFKEPTPIQRAAIPVGLQNRDIIGIAETGSGKTAAFLIPMLVFLSQQPRITAQTAELGPYALIMAPTRELAQQISAECNKFANDLNIRNACIVGGATIEEQGLRLRQGVELVIGTPGRLIDCIDRHYLVLDQCYYVVLDEADRMIDMNFEPQIKAVMDHMPATNLRPVDDDTNASDTIDKRYRQTVMFTATMPPKVMALAKKYLRSPVEVAVGDRRGKANANVELKFTWAGSDSEKRSTLMQLINDRQNFPMIVFCNFKKTCDFISRTLGDANVRCAVIHGSKTQDVREESLTQFKHGSIDVLVATDVLGRGIDISGVQHVVNFELPADIDKFTHRIGRTGRAGQRGMATSFLSDEDSGLFYDLRQLLEKASQPIPAALQSHESTNYKLKQSVNKRQRVDE